MTPEERAERVLGDYDCWPHEAAPYSELRTEIADAIRAAVEAERERCLAIARRLQGEMLALSDAESRLGVSGYSHAQALAVNRVLDAIEADSP